MSIKIYSKDDFEKMKVAGRLTASVLNKLDDFIKVGITTQEIDNFWHRISGAFVTRLGHAKQRIESINIKSPHQVVMEHQQRIDDISHTMDIIINSKIQNAHQKMMMTDGFINTLTARLATLNQSVNHIGQMLNSLSYKNVLARGYAIVRDSKDKIITRVDAGKPATIEFADGVLKI